MAYATLQNLIDRYGTPELTDLTDRSGAGVPDQTVAGVVLDDASQMIDAYVGSRYQVPLSPIPAIVTVWCCQIARFLLWKNAANEAVTALYKASIQQVASVQAGSLDLEASGVDQVVNADTVEFIAGSRRFGHWGGW